MKIIYVLKNKKAKIKLQNSYFDIFLFADHTKWKIVIQHMIKA